jgi:nicotinate phosphoribosyltransferase
VESFLDTDHYSFTMQQFVFQHYPVTNVTYKLIDRNKTQINQCDQSGFLSKFNDKLYQISSFAPTEPELEYLNSLQYFTPSYLNYLREFTFNKDEVHTYFKDNVFQIDVKGNWLECILWEVPLLAATTEIYCDINGKPNLYRHFERLREKCNQMGKLDFCEFGTRRRRNFDYQQLAVNIFKNASNFKGTSNTHLARITGTKCLGTIAHQIPMALSAKVGVIGANAVAMDKWTETYQGRLGVALTDTFTTDVFLKSFNGVRARIFDGVRQDSGEPLAFAHKIHKHYTNLEINPAHKCVYFSDGLTPLKCQTLEKNLDTPLQRVYCIGTDFTNDQKLNLIMKLTSVDGKPVVKLSDEQGKECGTVDEINRIKVILGL